MSQPFNNYTTTGSRQGCVCGAQTSQPSSCGCQSETDYCPDTEAEQDLDPCGREEEEATCPCRDSLAAALQLLCSGDLPALIDFNRFAFLTDNFLIGTYLECPCGQTGTYDNLGDLFTGSFNRFTPCSCDLIDVSGPVFDPSPFYPPQTVSNLFTVLAQNLDGVDDAQGTINSLNALAARIDPDNPDFRPEVFAAFQPLLGACSCPNITVSEVSLCSLSAIAFESAGQTPEQQAYNYQNAKQALLHILRPKCPPPCNPCRPPRPKKCVVPTCCENKGILISMDRCGMSRSVSLTAGNLLLVGGTLLGTIGNALILANDAENRFYFVCADQVEFLG